MCLEDLAPFHKTLPFPARAEMGKTLGLVQLAHPSYHPAATHTGFIDVMPFYCGMGRYDCRHLAFMQLGFAFTDGVWLLPRVYATLFHTRLASLSPPTEHLCPVQPPSFILQLESLCDSCLVSPHLLSAPASCEVGPWVVAL